MGVPARAAVEAPEGGRASENGAQPRPDISERRRFAGVARQMVGIAPFGASPPFFQRMILPENRAPLFGIMRVQGANLFLVRGRRQSSGG